MKLQINRLSLNLQSSAGVDSRGLSESIGRHLAAGVSGLSAAPQQSLRVDVTTQQQSTQGLSREVAKQILSAIARGR